LKQLKSLSDKSIHGFVGDIENTFRLFYLSPEKGKRFSSLSPELYFGTREGKKYGLGLFI
jgi:hypothetical protein